VKVLFLPKYPSTGASSRYCLYQFLPYLSQNGVQYDVIPFMSERLFTLSFEKGHLFEKLSLTLFSTLMRFSLLWKFRKYDLIFMHRELSSFGPPLVERMICSKGVPAIFCYDDALFIMKKNESNRLFNLLKNPNKILSIFSVVDCVLASNDYLQDIAAKYCNDARALDMPEDTNRISCKVYDGPHDTFTIGWIGSPSTEKYLKLIAPALQTVAEQYPQITLKVVGGGHYSQEGLNVTHVPWKLETEVAELHSFDVGIMPLPDDEWSLGKSGGKARIYMAAGLPVVCTAIGYNQQLIENKKTGYLVNGVEEWVEVISELIHDYELRKYIGMSAREHIEANLSLDVVAPQYLQIMKDVAHAE